MEITPQLVNGMPIIMDFFQFMDIKNRTIMNSVVFPRSGTRMKTFKNYKWK